jgi:crotonobetainyl-CoA:carnitine CoA-transferase CaiB-like acyl-CoA transferase
MVRLIVPDNLTAMTSAQAITAALLARERSGEGQHVRLSMIDAMISFLWTEGMAGYTFRGEGVDGERVTLSQDLIFETTDGYISTGAVSDPEWQGLVRALEKPEWLEDPRFQTPSNRMANAEARLALMGEVITKNTSKYWLDRLESESVPCAPVLRRREVFEHPQVLANKLIEESEHPIAGPIRQTRPAARFSSTPTEFRRHAPAVGEHTKEVLQELGLTATELEELERNGVIG